MSSDIDAKNYFQRLANFSGESVYKDMLHKAIVAFDRIEALEGENELVRAERHRAQTACEQISARLHAADARAERLRVALEQIAEHEPDATSWSVGWARKALEDDKSIRAAAGGAE